MTVQKTPAALAAALAGDIENTVVAATPGGIERQEAEGQKAFVADQTIPKNCPREALERAGFVFGEDADDLFVHVKFPEGWTKQATDHSMWSDLLDDKGRKRGGIFYKAAFYDRNADLYLHPRFSIRKDYDLEDATQYNVLDCGEVVFKTTLVECKKYSDEYWEAERAGEAEAKAHLDKHYPDWNSVEAYWD